MYKPAIECPQPDPSGKETYINNPSPQASGPIFIVNGFSSTLLLVHLGSSESFRLFNKIHHAAPLASAKRVFSLRSVAVVVGY